MIRPRLHVESSRSGWNHGLSGKWRTKWWKRGGIGRRLMRGRGARDHGFAVARMYSAILPKYERTGGASSPVALTAPALSNSSPPPRYGM